MKRLEGYATTQKPTQAVVDYLRIHGDFSRYGIRKHVVSELGLDIEVPIDHKFHTLTRSVGDAMCMIRPIHRYVLESYYLEEMTLLEVARTMGVTETRVHQKVEDALIEIRKVMRHMRRHKALLHSLELQDDEIDANVG